jgi:hypothetical protein
MGTSNFYNKNSSKIYACEIEEDFNYQDLVKNLKFELQAQGFDPTNEFDNERNFSGQYIATKKIQFTNVNQLIYLTIKAVVRSGYYNGVNLDYDFEIVGEAVNSYNNDFEINQKDDLDYQVARGFKTLFKKAKKTLEKKILKIEKIFGQNSQALKVGARFSNGETIYFKENQSFENYLEARC